MKPLKFDPSNCLISYDLTDYQKIITDIHNDMHTFKSEGNDFLGWLNLPVNISDDLINEIIQTAITIKDNFDTVVVIGIGGSYLGTKAALDFLDDNFITKKTEMIFAGHHLASDYYVRLLEYLRNKNYCLIVVSKSGGTTEPAVAFRILKDNIVKKYPDDYQKRIYTITDPSSGLLRHLTDTEGFKSFNIPSDVGGRYSLFTPATLLPLACAGYDIKAFVNGAKLAYLDLLSPDLLSNDAYHYALLRHLMDNSGKTTEIMASYEPRLNSFSEWWKQLFAESEGKNHRGLFVSSVNFTTDLHSLGQYIQDGKRIMFETIVLIKQNALDLKIPFDENNFDQLNYLETQTLRTINKAAYLGTLQAHTDGGVPNLVFELDKVNIYCFGYLTYFMMKACAMSSYLTKVNPFNQPGVEEYKTKMFEILGKK